MPTYSFNVQIVVPQAWSLLLFFLAQLVFFFGRRRFVDVFQICIDKFPVMRQWVGENLSRSNQTSDEQLIRKQQKILRSIVSAVFFLLLILFCYNYFPITIRSLPEKKVEIEYNEVITVNPPLPIQPMPVKPLEPMSRNAFNVLNAVLFLSFIGVLAVYFRGQVCKLFILCASYFHVVSGWLGEGRGRSVNMYMFCKEYFYIMRGFGGRLVDLFSQWKSKKKVDIKNKEVKTEKPRVVKQEMSKKKVEIKNEAVKTRKSLSLSFLKDLMVTFGGKLFDIYTFCTYYIHLICRWIGNLLKSVKRSRPLVREIEIEEEVDLKEDVTRVLELNEELLTVNPDDNEGLKKYIQTIIESLESLADEIQQPLLAENDVKSVLNRVDEIPGLVQKSIASLEFVHGKLYPSF